MINKEVGLKLFLGIFLLLILSSGVFAVEFGTCGVVPKTECTNDATNGYVVMGLSSATRRVMVGWSFKNIIGNAHGEIARLEESCNNIIASCSGLDKETCENTPGCNSRRGVFGISICEPITSTYCSAFETEEACSDENDCEWEEEYLVDYPYVLCCNFGTGNTECEGFTNKIIGLSAETNAHAEGVSGTSYINNVCYENIKCDLKTSCNSETENEILSLTATTNAHIGGAGDYPNKVCCTKGSMARGGLCEINSVNWTNSEGNVISAILENKEAYMMVKGTNCDGTPISLQIYEDKTFDEKIGDVQRIFDSANRIVELLNINKEVGSKYYFTANTTSSNIIKSGNLEIRNKDICVLEDLNVCEDYTNEEDCNSDVCIVSKDQIESLEEDESFCETYNCNCIWNNNENTCSPVWSEPLNPVGVCGNGIPETGEQCDDGNLNNNDGCYANCTYEIVDSPCPEGLVLCSDGTCSLNCEVTDDGTTCNYNGICETGEGCNCNDCDNKLDECRTDLLCSVDDLGCCNYITDGVCEESCASVDPDCSGGFCGDGLRQYEEQCDLGTENGKTNSGCSIGCIFDVEIPISGKCPEGLSLCNDGNCSLNCYATDQGVNPVCRGAGCCSNGLIYSLIDEACCNPISDGYCNPYCSFTDPDCGGKILDPFLCKITQTITNDCDEEPTGYKIVEWTGEWTGETTSGKEYDKCISGGTSQIPCAAKLQLPFFDYIEFIIAIAIIAIIYSAVIYNKKHKKKKVESKKRK